MRCSWSALQYIGRYCDGGMSCFALCGQAVQQPYADADRVAAVGYCFGGGGIINLMRAYPNVTEGLLGVHLSHCRHSLIDTLHCMSIPSASRLLFPSPTPFPPVCAPEETESLMHSSGCCSDCTLLPLSLFLFVPAADTSSTKNTIRDLR